MWTPRGGEGHGNESTEQPPLTQQWMMMMMMADTRHIRGREGRRRRRGTLLGNFGLLGRLSSGLVGEEGRTHGHGRAFLGKVLLDH
jgi:hypothetical protein